MKKEGEAKCEYSITRSKNLEFSATYEHEYKTPELKNKKTVNIFVLKTDARAKEFSRSLSQRQRDVLFAKAFAAGEKREGKWFTQFFLGESCHGTARIAETPVAMLTLISETRKTEMYPYALWPSAGVFLKEEQTREAIAGTIDVEAISTVASSTREYLGSSTGVKAIGFSANPNTKGAKAVQFGWLLAVDPNGNVPQGLRLQRPSNQLLSAIVRVPAWWQSLRIAVDVGWDGDTKASSKHSSIR